MARPPIDQLPPENQRVARAWEDAKRRDPSLTQAEFSAAVFGGRRRHAGKAFSGPPETWTRRQAEADARYLRLILEGKRRPVQLVKRSDRGGVVNVAVRRGRGFVSFNLRLPPGTSKLDAFKLRETKGFRKTLQAQAAAWAKRYNERRSRFNLSETDIRGVRHARKRPVTMAP